MVTVPLALLGAVFGLKLFGASVNIFSQIAVIMKPGDVAAMPADIRHQGYSKKRSMLLVWENATPELPQLYESGKLKPYPIEF